MVRIEVCIDREGNTGMRDVYFVCPSCRDKYDTYKEAKECLLECAKEEWGTIDEVVEDSEPDDYIED